MPPPRLRYARAVPSQTAPGGGLVRALGLAPATAVLIANVVGTGVFVKTRVMTCNVGSPDAVLWVWLVAGLLSLACNLVEIKSDLFKLVRVYQRPVAARAATIGVWAKVLQAMVCLSVLTNAMLFSMSEQLASWCPSLYRAPPTPT